MTTDTSKFFPGMPDNAKVWVYQSDRLLNDNDKAIIQTELNAFLDEWHAHGSELKADGAIFFDRFVILTVDEEQAMASGCSIDSSVRKMSEIGVKSNINFFERTNIAYLQNGEISLIPFTDLKKVYDQKEINDDTYIFDNSIQDIGTLRSRWIVKLKASPAVYLVS